MIGKAIAAGAVLFALGMWAAPAQAVEINLTSPQEGTTVYPGDFVEITATVTNETDKKDIIHIVFDLVVEVGGQPLFAGQAKMRMKLAPGETVSETMGAEIPDPLPLPGEGDVTITATANGKISKTQDTDSLFLTVAPSP
jgi:hypothetical protein